ncbi:MAG: hypothetical protein LBQ12_02430 [Deltaproteobacteria bacterium]|jgi:hypothetical protein|nr:hypothetical protein [Deltaproteobacteria bacterium]
MNKLIYSSILIFFLTLFVSQTATPIFAATEEPIDDWFTSVAWTEKGVELTAKKAATVLSVSIIAEGKEIKATSISNTKGDLKFPNGGTAWAGSSLLFTSSPFIIPADTEVICKIDAGTAQAQEIRVFLEGDITLSKKL